MRRHLNSSARVFLVSFLAILPAISGCGVPLATLSIPAPATSAPSPVVGTMTLSPTLAYQNGKRFVITLSSTSFGVADTITSVQPYDANMVALSPWTIYAQSQDSTNMTITAVFTAGDGMPVPIPPTPGKTPKPQVGGVLVTTTIKITTMNTVTGTIPVKPVNIDPCGS